MCPGLFIRTCLEPFLVPFKQYSRSEVLINFNSKKCLTSLAYIEEGPAQKPVFIFFNLHDDLANAQILYGQVRATGVLFVKVRLKKAGQSLNKWFDLFILRLR